MLPELRSGKTNTLARPSRGLSGHFFFATSGRIAASNWISPSTRSPGSAWRTRATASLTRSIEASFALSRVEKERNATRGSWPKARALCALARPISASVSASGAMFMEQSA